jgi:hypothetical protein
MVIFYSVSHEWITFTFVKYDIIDYMSWNIMVVLSKRVVQITKILYDAEE